MKSKYFIALVFLLTRILSFGQTEKIISIDQSGDLVFARGFLDSKGYSVMAYHFSPKNALFVFLDPNQNEISRQSLNGTKLTINGFSSTSKEFIVYFDGVVNGTKMSSYFVAFFKDGRTPILSNWMDIPDTGEKLFTYSNNDKFFVSTREKKGSLLKIFEVSSVNNLDVKTFQLDKDLLNELTERIYTENSSWGSFIGGTNIINPYIDSLRIIFPVRLPDDKDQSLQILTFSMEDNSITKKTILPNQLDAPQICMVDNFIFVLDKQRGVFNHNSVLTIVDLKSSKAIKSHRINPDSLGLNIKIDPIVNRHTGEVWKEDITTESLKRFIHDVNGLSIVGADKSNGTFKLRLGGVKVVMSGYQGPGQPSSSYSNYLPFIFSLGLDDNFNLVWQTQNDDYINFLKKFQEQKLKKLARKPDELFFFDNLNSIIAFYVFEKTNQSFIYKKIKE